MRRLKSWAYRGVYWNIFYLWAFVGKVHKIHCIALKCLLVLDRGIDFFFLSTLVPVQNRVTQKPETRVTRKIGLYENLKPGLPQKPGYQKIRKPVKNPKKKKAKTTKFPKKIGLPRVTRVSRISCFRVVWFSGFRFCNHYLYAFKAIYKWCHVKMNFSETFPPTRAYYTLVFYSLFYDQTKFNPFSNPKALQNFSKILNNNEKCL